MANSYDFVATNKLSTKDLFENRKQYRDEALYLSDEDQFVSGIQDFFIGTELSFYGRIDDDRKFVVLNSSKASYFSPSNKSRDAAASTSPRAADFVVDAYKEFFKEFETIVAESRCGVEPSELKVKVVSAWHPVEQIQEASYTVVARSLIRRLLTNPGNRQESSYKKINKIKTVEQFVKLVLPALKQIAKAGPVNASSLLSSKYCSLSTSGLAIVLDKSKFDDDTEKSAFMNKAVFGFYRQAAMKHGFVINRNAPWQIVADIDSEAMTKYMEARSTTRETLWTTHYSRAHYNDILKLQQFILRLWNEFVTRQPISIVREPMCGGSKTKPVVTRRLRYTMQELEDKLDSKWWIWYYCNIKSAEAGQKNKLSENSVDRMVKNAVAIEKNVDMPSAIDYINDQFKVSVFEERLQPQKFLPNAESLEKGKVSPHQSNVIIETTDY